MHKKNPAQTLSPTRQRILDLHRSGLPGTDIAKVVGVTHQRVYQHLKALREAGLVQERAS